MLHRPEEYSRKTIQLGCKALAVMCSKPDIPGISNGSNAAIAMSG